MTHPKKAEQQALQALQAPQGERSQGSLGDCPRCAGNKRVMDFRSGDRTTGETAGWKAIECPYCGGVGSVDEKTAAAILAKMEQNSPA